MSSGAVGGISKSSPAAASRRSKSWVSGMLPPGPSGGNDVPEMRQLRADIGRTARTNGLIDMRPVLRRSDPLRPAALKFRTDPLYGPVKRQRRAVEAAAGGWA